MAIIAVMDTETTGLPHAGRQARVIEVGVVLVNLRGQLSERWESLARPARYEHGVLERAAFRVHGITPEMIASAPDDHRVGMVLRDWLIAHEVAAVTSWKTAFDFHPHFLRHKYWLGPLLPSLIEFACVRSMTEERLDSKLSLPKALKAFGLTFEGPRHRALTDAVAAARVLSCLLGDLTDEQRQQLSRRLLQTPDDRRVPWTREDAATLGLQAQTKE